jgi:predicted Zn-dependent peptidase
VRRLWLTVLASAVVGAPFMKVSKAEEKDPRVALERLRESVRSEVLSNGVRVTLYKRGYAPVFSGVVAVRVGGVDERKGHTGISHLFEHMAFKGTPEVGTRDFEKERVLLARYEDLMQKRIDGAKLTADEQQLLEQLSKELESLILPEEFSAELSKRGATGLNATTSTELTTYFVNLPRTAFEFWAWAESERIIRPVMRQFYQERDVVMEERRMRVEDDPVGKLYEQLLDTAYQIHPYRYPVIGYQDDLTKLTATMTAEFHSRYYVGENIAVSVVGDINPDEILPVIERYFGRIPQGPRPQHPTEVEPEQTEERFVTVERKASPVVFLGYHKPSYPDPRDARISLLEEVLAGSVISPLYKKLVIEQQVATSVGVYEVPGSAYPNLVVFQLVPRHPHTASEVVEAFDVELEKFITHPVAVEQVNIAKRSILVEHLGDMKSSMSLARQFASSQLLYGSWDAALNWLNEVITVTPEEIDREAKLVLRRTNRTVAILRPKKDE